MNDAEFQHHQARNDAINEFGKTLKACRSRIKAVTGWSNDAVNDRIKKHLKREKTNNIPAATSIENLAAEYECFAEFFAPNATGKP